MQFTTANIIHALFLVTLITTTTTALPQPPTTGFHGKRLIKLKADDQATWMSEADLLKLYRDNQHFVDITETPDLELPGFAEPTAIPVPTDVTQQSMVKAMLPVANTELMRAFLAKFTAFNNRYFRSETGTQSSQFLFDTVKQLVDTANPGHLNITVTQFTNTFTQPSVIARIEGLDGNDETVIVGAHQDSVNGSNPMAGRSPGADDDGSGTATILEAFRVLLANKYQPKRPVEFHWYAGEEGGLLGSAAIAQSFKTAGRKVAGMIQFDMTMFPSKTNPDIGILTDFVDPTLTDFLEKVVQQYSSIKAKRFTCGYGCSDHASWNRAGYRSSLPFESSNVRGNGNIHTSRDDLPTLDYNHGLELSKVAVGFAVEMSHQ
jgi:leucyl aminopeptidase